MSVPSLLHVFMNRAHTALFAAACAFFLVLGCFSRLYAKPPDPPYFVFYNVAVSFTPADLGFSDDSVANPHGSFQTSTGWQSGTVSGTELQITDYPSVSSVSRTHILFWEYFNGRNKESFSVSFQLTQPTLTSQLTPSSHILIVSAISQTIAESRPQPGGPYWTYSGYGDLVFDITQASRAGLYTGGVITQTVTVL